ncbi:MAG: hypothetical protein ACREBB_02335 [Nitrosotalea sp.]
MKYFWWRLLDYATGVLGGGVIVFHINKFLCHKCLGPYTTIMFLGIWIAVMLVVNMLFQAAKPQSISKN